MSTSGWADIMYQAQDAMAPSVWIFFVVIVIFTAWFASNLAIAVLYTEFAAKERRPPPPPREWSEVAEADRAIPAEGPVGRFRHFVRHRVACSAWFSSLTIFCIVINSIFLAIVYHGMSEAYATTLEQLNFALAVYFGAEMVLKVRLGLKAAGSLRCC